MFYIRLKCFLVVSVKINYDTVTFVNYVVKVVDLYKSQSGNCEFWIDKLSYCFSRAPTPPQECPSPTASPHPGSRDSECDEEGATVSDQLHRAWEGGHTPLPPGKTEVPVLQQCTLDPQPEKRGIFTT